MAGTSTTFTVDHLREPAKSRPLRDGSVYEGWRVSGETSIEIKVEVQDHAYLVMKAEGQSCQAWHSFERRGKKGKCTVYQDLTRRFVELLQLKQPPVELAFVDGIPFGN